MLQVAGAEQWLMERHSGLDPQEGKNTEGFVTFWWSTEKGPEASLPRPPSPLILFNCVYFPLWVESENVYPYLPRGNLEKTFWKEKEHQRSTSKPILPPSAAVMIKTKPVAVICLSWCSFTQAISAAATEFALEAVSWKSKHVREKKEMCGTLSQAYLQSALIVWGEKLPLFFWQSQLLMILWKVNTRALSSDTFNGPKNNLHRHCRSKKKKKKKSCSFYPSKGKKCKASLSALNRGLIDWA